MMEETRICRECDKDLPLSDYRRNMTKRWGLDGLALICRECDNARAREYYRRNKNDPKFQAKRAATRRDSYLKQRYGITAKEYDALLAAQDGGCKICGQAQEARALAVDESGGLLCAACHAGLGMFQRDPGLLVRASEYLK